MVQTTVIMIYFECKSCSWKVSGLLDQHHVNKEFSYTPWKGQKPEMAEYYLNDAMHWFVSQLHFPQHNYVFVHARYYVQSSQTAYMHCEAFLDPLYWDCCGTTAFGPANQFCLNCNSPIGRRISSCSYYDSLIRFEENAVNVVEIPYEFEDHLMQLERETEPTSIELNGLLSLLKTDQKAFDRYSKLRAFEQ